MVLVERLTTGLLISALQGVMVSFTNNLKPTARAIS
jgi:hypothetical protein